MVTMPSRPAITVTIPIYNGERYLAETIQSLMAQTFCDFQVIIVDDCSSDGSHALVRKYAEGDFRFVLIRTLEEPREHIESCQLRPSARRE